MTSSINLKKIISIGAAALLAIGGSLTATSPANATPITNIKSMAYTIAWLPGATVEATFTSTRIGFSSQFEMDDVTAYRGQAITVASTNTGFPSGSGLADNVYVTFYASLANRTSNQTISGSQIYNTNNSSVTVPANALAMRVQYSNAFNGDSSRTLAAGSYGSTPHVFHAGTEIPTTNASSGSNLYLTSSSASVEGATSAFTTPATGTIRSTSFKVAGCLNLSAITSSTTYTATLKVNGTTVSGMTDYVVSALGGYSYTEVTGASNSFSTGQLNTWRTAGQALKIVVNNNSNTSLTGSATSYDATLTLVDQSNTSLLADCSPVTPSGSGTISAGITPGSLSFTPDSTLGANANWEVNVYKASDDSFVSSAPGMGSSATMLMPPMGQMGPGSWTAGAGYYAKAVNSVTIISQTFTSSPGTASATYVVPSSSGSGGGGSSSGGGISSGTLTTPATTPVVANGSISVTQGTWTGAVSLTRSWRLCNTAISASAGSYMANPPQFPPTGCSYFTTNPLTSVTLSSNDMVRTNPLTIPATVNLVGTCVAQQNAPSLCTTTSTSTTGKFLSWYEFDNGAWSTTAAVAVDGSIQNVQDSAPTPAPLRAEDALRTVKPLPVIVQPLVAALPALSKPLVDAGGKVDLTAGDFTGLVSASISGKPLDLAVGATGGLTITVPNGKAGTTADLLLNFKSGVVILQDAIKYVAPVVVSAVPERSVSISAGSAKLSEASANQVRQAAFAKMSNTAISCVAYAANGTAAARAAALATAQQACALATKANPNLVAAPVTVIVNKAKAKTAAVGIKVYKK